MGSGDCALLGLKLLRWPVLFGRYHRDVGFLAENSLSSVKSSGLHSTAVIKQNACLPAFSPCQAYNVPAVLNYYLLSCRSTTWIKGKERFSDCFNETCWLYYFTDINVIRTPSRLPTNHRIIKNAGLPTSNIMKAFGQVIWQLGTSRQHQHMLFRGMD